MTDHSITSEQIGEVAGLLRQARRVLVITGAGISADSGLPTYRGIGGLYDEKLTDDAIPIEDALSGGMLQRNPELTWKYIAQIEAACRGAKHNGAHAALARLEPHFEKFCVLTQNVDGFHRDAGSQDVIEMHGNIHELFCMRCRQQQRVVDYSAIQTLPPRCDCGGIIRPRVVLFGEQLPGRALDQYYRVLENGVDLVMTVGTTAVFPYISAPVEFAAAKDLPTVEINPGVSEISHLVSHRLPARAIDVLPTLCERLSH